MRTLTVAAATVIAGLSSAQAQDGGSAAHSWTGFYVGLHAGAIRTHGADSVGTNLGSGAPAGSAAFAATIAQNLTGSTDDMTLLTGGGQLGYNWRINSVFVGGFEADISAIDHKSGELQANVPFPGFPGFTIGTDLTNKGYTDYLGTVRGRFGYLVTPDLLVFVTGGLAYGHVDTTTRYRITAPGTALVPPDATFGGSSMRAGYTIGSGFELAISSNISFKVEGLFYDLGSVTENVTITSRSGGLFVASTGLSNTVDFDGAIARVGVNLGF